MKRSGDLGKTLKEAGILFAITLIAGLILGFVNQLTADPIAKQQELKIQKACATVFAQAASFEERVEDASGAAYQAAAGLRLGKVYTALAQDGSVMGYVIDVTSTEGYGGDIEIMMGVTTEGRLNGISILSISETPGLGMQAGEVLVPQFADKEVKTFQYTKSGAKADNEIDAISGATITTKAVTGAVNEGLAYFREVLQNGGVQ